MPDETIVTEAPPPYDRYGRVGEQVRAPITGHRSKRLLHGAINVRGGDVGLPITEQWTNETHQTSLAMVRSHWRGWNIALSEGRASQHERPSSLAWAEGPGIEVRLLPKAEAAPQRNAMDHPWRHTKREAVGSRATEAVATSALDACRYIIDLGPRDRLRQAGALSGDFWLTRWPACQRTFCNLLGCLKLGFLNYLLEIDAAYFMSHSGI